MDDSNVWLPHLDLLQLAYEQNKSYFHSQNHALRVWAFSMLISEQYQDRIDRDVLSAAALFHCIKKERDWNEEEHIEKTVTWIKEYLPTINPDFQADQIDLIGVLCIRQDSKDHSLDTLESKILNDADLLDKHRLIRKKVNQKDFALEESSDLLQFSKSFYQKWKKNTSKHRKTPPEILKITLRETPELRKYQDCIQLDQLNIKNRKKYQKTFQKLERNITRLKHSCSQFNSSLINGTLSIKDIDYLEGSIENILSINTEECIPCIATHFEAKNIIRKCLRKSLPDQTLSGKERKSIRKLYQKCLPESDEVEMDSSKITSLTPLFYSNQYKENPEVTKALKNYLAYINEEHLLEMSIVFTQKRARSILIETFRDNELHYSDLELSITEEELADNMWLWLRFCEKLVDQVKKGHKNSSRYRNLLLINYLYRFINRLLNLYSLEIRFVTFILEQIRKINLITLDTKLEQELVDALFSNFQKDLLLEDKITMIEGGSMNSNLNLFHIYDEDDSVVGDFLSSFEKVLISFSNLGYEIDGVIRDFLLPVALNEEFNYSVDANLIDLINNRENIDIIEKYNTLRKKNKNANIQDLTYLYIKEKSSKNIQQLTNQSKHHALVQTKNDYRIVSKVLNFEIIESILKHNSFLLSPYNILDIKPQSMVYKPTEEGSHRDRLKVIDALQRYTLTRRPDIYRDHIYYGAMHSMKDLLANSDILEKLPSPTSYIPKKKFGRIILVFKDKIKERTFFTKHDSLWENRIIPVLFDEAKYLYEEINSRKISSSYYNDNEKQKNVERPYVEANILGGVDLSDVEMIIAPKKQVEKKEELVEQLLEKYQHIELLTI